MDAMTTSAAARHSSEQVPDTRLQPKDLLDRARDLFEKGNLAQSETLYKQAAGFRETAGDAFYGLGVVYLKAGNSAAAMIAFGESVKRAPLNSNAYYYLGQIWEEQGSTEAALGFFKTALQIDPSHRGARQRMAALDRSGLQGERHSPETNHDGIGSIARRNGDGGDHSRADGLSGIRAVLEKDATP